MLCINLRPREVLVIEHGGQKMAIHLQGASSARLQIDAPLNFKVERKSKEEAPRKDG